MESAKNIFMREKSIKIKTFVLYIVRHLACDVKKDRFRLDKYESSSQLSTCFSVLASLMDDNEQR